MCDYSLEALKSRKAVVGDKLVTRNFGHGTSGFASATDGDAEAMTAICLLPGTELSFDAPVQTKAWTKYGTVEGIYCAVEHAPATIEHKVARFTKINTDNYFTHHDGLEFPGVFGVDPCLLNHLVEGQTATVLQLGCVEEPAKVDPAVAKAPEYTD
jgi:hypothetical protein